MKKNILILLLTLIILISLFINYMYLSEIIILALYLFLLKIVPFFIPIFIISKVFINYNLFYYVAKLFKNNIYIYILFISFLVGCPSNIILIKDLLNNNVINIKEANIYIKCSYFVNPLFLYSILSNIFNKYIALIIILIEILSNIIIYLRYRVKNNNIIKIESNTLINTLINSIKEMIPILEFIFITIIIFNILIYIIPGRLSNFVGLLEITSGLNNLINSNMSIFYKLILSVTYISFGGLSIHLQVNYLLENSKIKYSSFLLGRIFQILISILLVTTYYGCIATN